MFHEMATVGVAMATLVTVTWAIMVLVSSRIEKREANPASSVPAEAVVRSDEAKN